MRKPRTKKDMISYLSDHFRYSTMNNWNRGSSYARNVKLSRIKFPDKQTENRAWDMICNDVQEAFYGVREIMDDFAINHDWRYQIGFNGRSSGYMVLYQGERKLSQHKSICTSCGQRNFQEVTDQTGNACGRCGRNSRVNRAMYEVTVSGEGMDDERDYEDWSIDSLRSRVNLVWDFNQTVDLCIEEFISFCQGYEVAEETIMVPKTIHVARMI
jgi:hypothetical protein